MIPCIAMNNKKPRSIPPKNEEEQSLLHSHFCRSSFRISVDRAGCDVGQSQFTLLLLLLLLLLLVVWDNAMLTVSEYLSHMQQINNIPNT